MRQWVSNAEKLFEVLASDCTHDQFLRELVVNAIQAKIPTRALKIEVGGTATDKIYVEDDGTGIQDLERATCLASDTGIAGINKGIGGKIASLRFSPYGVEYQTAYGGVADGYMLRTRPALSASAPIKATFVGQHGTRVVLHGTGADDKTVYLPGKNTNAGWWVTQYLNRRFFEIPEGVRIQTAGSKFSFSSGRRIMGAREVLEKSSSKNGIVRLPEQGCDVLWFLLPQKQQANKSSVMHGYEYAQNFLGATGFTAFLHQQIPGIFELYNIADGVNSCLESFGIRLGKVHVIILVKPTTLCVDDDAARSTLFMRDADLNRVPVPLREIGAAFREKLPVVLRDYQNELERKSERSVDRAHKQRLFNIFAPIWTSLTARNFKVVPASPATVASAGGDAIGTKDASGTGAGRCGIGKNTPGYRPDVTSKEKRRVGLARGLPEISLCTESDASSPHAMRFVCVEKGFTDAMLVLNEAWAGWEKQAVALKRAYEKEVTLASIQNTAVNQVYSTIYTAMAEHKSGNKQPLAVWTTPDALTAISASILLQKAASGGAARKEITE